MPQLPSPTENEVIQRSQENTLYTHSTDEVRFFQAVYENSEAFEFQVSSRVMFKCVYSNRNSEFDSIEIIQLTNGSEKWKVRLWTMNITRLRQFLELLTSLDIPWIQDWKIRIGTNLFSWELDEESQRSIIELLSRSDSTNIIEALLSNGTIKSKDIVNTWYRKDQLEIFQKLLDDRIFFEEYRLQNWTSWTKDEKVWQIFFEKNEWIFWYWLQYRFQWILQREASISDSNIDGGWTVITDFLLADNNFTTFVELKKPETPIFRNSINRSNAWRLSNELIDSVSQTLEQKASWQIKLETDELFDGNWGLITQKAIDSKVILITWRDDQLVWENARETKIKKRTFELYRRDSRNIEIITYDELLDRARHIVWPRWEVIDEVEDITPF